jgi:trehalose/maltose hydrolase-like predicted phosphorylase
MDQTAQKTWLVEENRFLAERQNHMETILTQGNGYLSTRGTFEERYPLDRQATLIHGIWDDIPIAFTELVNAPDWTSLEIWISGQRFDMSQGKVHNYVRYLDLRTGILHRALRWSPDNGINVVELSFERFTSLADQHMLAQQVQITPLTSQIMIRVRSSLDGHVDNEGYLHWQTVFQDCTPNQIDIQLRTRKTKKLLAMSARLTINNPNAKPLTNDSRGCPGIETIVYQNMGEPLILRKIVGVATSRDSDNPLGLAQDKSIKASTNGYEKIRLANTQMWEDFWEKCDVHIEGDDIAQLAIRHALFQLRIAAPTRDKHVSIGAKTLSGFGYRGHVFWDTEIFVLPFFCLTQPEISRNMLCYRYYTLQGARRKATANGYEGAQFAWESAETGDEVTPPWVPNFNNPLQLVRIWTGDIEVHISADIAYAVYQYWQLTGDDEFWCDMGIPILLETAIFWGNRVEAEGKHFSIRDIIGPDEYHEHVDNNVYTNRMVQWHLGKALDSLTWLRDHYPEKHHLIIKGLDLNKSLLSHWEKVRDNLVILQDPDTGLYEQFEGFFNLKEVDWPNFSNRTKSMQELLGIEGANVHQVLKQADVIMLLCLLRHNYNEDVWRINWDYYNDRTDHSYGSSLGPAMQAWAACEMSLPDLAYEHFMRAAQADLFNVRRNSDDGIHAASAGGLWQAVAFGFAGLDISLDRPRINPRLPSNWTGLSFKITFRGNCYEIDIKPGHSSIKVDTGSY